MNHVRTTASVMFIIFFACGRTELDSPFDPGASGGSDAGTPGGSGGRGGAGGGVGSDGGVPGTGGGGATTGSGGSGGVAGGGGGVDAGGGFAGFPGNDAGFPMRDAGGRPDVRPVDAPPSSPGRTTCGNTSCDAETQSCCIGTSGTARCTAKDAFCAGASLSCDEKADCPGGTQYCCASSSGGGFPRATCAMTCSGMGSAVLCRSGADCPGSQPNCCGLSGMGLTVFICSRMPC